MKWYYLLFGPIFLSAHVSIVCNVILVVIGGLGIIEKIWPIKIKWERKIWMILLVIFCMASFVNIFFSLSNEGKINKQLFALRSFELHISVSVATPTEQVKEKVVNIGPMNVVALFSEDNTRYRFKSETEWEEEQITPAVKRLNFIYKPESLEQLAAKSIDFLQNISTLTVNYSKFCDVIKIDEAAKWKSMKAEIFINGVKATEYNYVFSKTVPFRDQISFSVNKQFYNIGNRYSLAMQDAE